MTLINMGVCDTVTRKKVFQFESTESTDLFKKMIESKDILKQMDEIENALLRHFIYVNKNIEEKLNKLEYLHIPVDLQKDIKNFIEFKGLIGKGLYEDVKEFLFTQTTNIKKIDDIKSKKSIVLNIK